MLFFRPSKSSQTTKKQAPVNKVARKSRDPRTPLAENSKIEGYQFLKVIGRGSFSLVYQCLDIQTQEKVVIKEYFPKHTAYRKNHSNDIRPVNNKKLAVYREGIKQFFKEAIALNKICHPNALKTCNVFRANRTTYMVSKGLAGHDLKRFLTATQNPLSQEYIFKVFMPILSALSYLHSADLMHLDVKPANILLRLNSEPLLLDFGAAQTFSSRKRIDQMQTLTHGFAPPEQYDKNQSLGPWTDIYAVAASLYYCIACKAPNKSKDSKKTSQLDLQVYGDQYDRGLLLAINRGLSFDPKQRYTNIDEFAYALLASTSWRTLEDYEQRMMGYDRNRNEAFESQQELITVLAQA